MKKSILEKNREYSEKFIQPESNSLVPEEIKNILIDKKTKSVIDLGCGDGLFLQALKKEFPKIKISGIDISPRRIDALKNKIPKGKFYCQDVCSAGLKEKFDFVHSSQVLEHVENDMKMVEEMKKILKKEGTLFVSSVIKKSWAVYKYKNNGKFVLDPTHEREYKNMKEFLDLFKKDFKLIKSWIDPVKRKFLGISFTIPGYYLVYGIWKKRK